MLHNWKNVYSKQQEKEILYSVFMYVSASQFGMVKIVSYYISIGNMLKNVSWIRSKLKVVNKTFKSLPIMVSFSANFHSLQSVNS